MATHPDVLTLILADHKAIRAGFRAIDKIGDRAHKSLVREVQAQAQLLARHAACEEAAFYPGVREELAKLTDDVLESLEEHHVVKLLLSEIEKTDPANERYRAKLTVLEENVVHHLKEEETEMIPTVRKALSLPTRREMGMRYQQAAVTAPTRAHPHAPDEPPLALVANAVAAPLDRAIDGAKSGVRRTARRIKAAR